MIFIHRCGIFKCHSYKSKYKKVGVLPIRRVTSNVLSVGPSSEKNMRTVSGSDEGPTLETLEFTIRIGSIPTFSHFDLYLYAAHYVYLNVVGWTIGRKLKGKFRLISNSSHDDFQLKFIKSSFQGLRKEGNYFFGYIDGVTFR